MASVKNIKDQRNLKVLREHLQDVLSLSSKEVKEISDEAVLVSSLLVNAHSSVDNVGRLFGLENTDEAREHAKDCLNLYYTTFLTLMLRCAAHFDIDESEIQGIDFMKRA